MTEALVFMGVAVVVVFIGYAVFGKPDPIEDEVDQFFDVEWRLNGITYVVPAGMSLRQYLDSIGVDIDSIHSID